VRLATRGSPLALIQTGLVASALAAAVPGLVVEQVVVRTRGDRLAEVPLDRIGGQGVFVKEVQAAVLEGRADAAVHSAKDLPSETPDGLTIAAIPLRADPKDALVGCALGDLGPGAVVATGSARRRAQLANVRPDLTFVELRGNMATRLARAGDGSVDAVVVAQAALDRLGWSDRSAEVLSPALMLPQVGQGALAVECRRDDRALVDLLASVDHEASHRAVTAERSFLAAIGGSCTLPVGAWAEPADGESAPAGEAGSAGTVATAGSAGPAATLRLHAVMASPDGRILVRTHGCGDDPVLLGRDLAARLLVECGGAGIDPSGRDDPSGAPSESRGS
jgi:hydroxymethylbilane synthase